ncbi:hypothetical protein Q3G72_017925 [Acer saccharum]|nr:hypothetical protein Q3G72_017925 [Acer saccharum]
MIPLAYPKALLQLDVTSLFGNADSNLTSSKVMFVQGTLSLQFRLIAATGVVVVPTAFMSWRHRNNADQ